jgi:hypothetical protein
MEEPPASTGVAPESESALVPPAPLLELLQPITATARLANDHPIVSLIVPLPFEVQHVRCVRPSNG